MDEIGPVGGAKPLLVNLLGAKKEYTGQTCHCGGKIVIITTQVRTGKMSLMIGGTATYPETRDKKKKKCEKCGVLFDI